MSIESRMNKMASFLNPREYQGGWNEERTEYQSIITLPCRLVNLTGRKYFNGRVREEATHQLFCITDIEIDTSWIVEVDEKRYSIVPPVVDAGGGISHHLEIGLKEV